MAQAGYVGLGLPSGDRALIRLPGWPCRHPGQVAGELDHFAACPAPGAQPGVGKELQHLGVLSQDRAGEGPHALMTGGRPEVLEQQRANTSPVHIVGHGQGDLGRALPEDLIAPHADELSASQGEERQMVRSWHAAHPFGLTLGGQLAEAEGAPVLVAGGHRLVHRLNQPEIGWRGGPDLDRRAVRQQRVRAGQAALHQPVAR